MTQGIEKLSAPYAAICKQLYGNREEVVLKFRIIRVAISLNGVKYNIIQFSSDNV